MSNVEGRANQGAGQLCSNLVSLKVDRILARSLQHETPLPLADQFSEDDLRCR